MEYALFHVQAHDKIQWASNEALYQIPSVPDLVPVNQKE